MEVGEIYTDRFFFKQEEIIAFCDLVGDINPIHRDKQFAKESGYTDCLVQGICAVAIFSARASKLMPSFIKAIECSRQTNYIRPIQVGEMMVLLCKIIDLDPANKRGVVRELLKNSKGQICIESIVETKML